MQSGTAHSQQQQQQQRRGSSGNGIVYM